MTAQRRTRQPRTRLERLGGRDALVAIVETFYDRIEADAELRPVFPPDLRPGRDKQAAFLEQWMGGEPLYTRIYGEPALRRRHRPFAITERGAERWLAHLEASFEAHGTEEALTREIMDALRPLALRMVNTTEVRTRPGA